MYDTKLSRKSLILLSYIIQKQNGMYIALQILKTAAYFTPIKRDPYF